MAATQLSSAPLDLIPPAVSGTVEQYTALDGTMLRYRHWPATGPDAAVYLHGIAGHSLWFSAAATRLAAQGVSIYGLDRRGSGLNDHLEPGHLGHFQHLLRDIEHFLDLTRLDHKGGKVFLLAGCWGAKAGAIVAARQAAALDGLVLIAPALSVRVSLPLRHLIGVACSLLLAPRRRFPIPLEPPQYTNNPEYRAFIAADPRRLLTATARFYLETARLDRLAARAPGRIVAPVLLQAGLADRIVNCAGLQRWFSRLASTDRNIKLYPDYGHILEFEAQPEAYLRDLLGWFKDHSSAAAGVE